MATIKAIESRSVHQIQSGQVIVDLISVVKELVENSLDAGATSVEVRFKNHGLDSIEVQDNGKGISPEDFSTIALKHYTSKLSSYEDLNSLDTFGFRGEALSSLCALSNFHIITARSEDGAVGKKLEFESSGKLSGTSVVAAQKGTTVSVENLFANLPVRRKELEKNMKREYGKALSHLYAYACISVGVRISVSNQMPKAKKAPVFSTKANPTTRENIANVFGAKTLLSLVELDLHLEMEPSKGPSTQSGRNWSTQAPDRSKEVVVEGHISRPVFGEGRQAPDRQMFFVNSRPCTLPQISKAFNEVYKSFNVSQTPFIFANLIMDTNAYDVNVSPDKRSILLHDQAALLESMKQSLTELFEKSDYTLPQSTLQNRKLPTYKPLTIPVRSPANDSIYHEAHESGEESESDGEPREHAIPRRVSRPRNEDRTSPGLIQAWAERGTTLRTTDKSPSEKDSNGASNGKRRLIEAIRQSTDQSPKPITHNKEQSDSAQDSGNDERFSSANEPVSSDEAAARSEQQTDVPAAVPPFVNIDNEGSPRDDHFPRISTNQQRRVEDFKALMDGKYAKDEPVHAELESDLANGAEDVPEPAITAFAPSSQKSTPGPVQNAFDRMRPQRTPLQTAEVTIGGVTTTTVIGSGPPHKKRKIHQPVDFQSISRFGGSQNFAHGLKSFAAPGSEPGVGSSNFSAKFQRSLEDSDREAEESASEPDDIASVEGDGSEEESDAQENDADQEVMDDDPTSDPLDTQFLAPPDDDQLMDEDYIDEADKKAREDQKVARLIQEAERAAAQSTEGNLRRASQALKNTGNRKDSTLQLVQYVDTSVLDIRSEALQLKSSSENSPNRLNSSQNQGAVLKDQIDDSNAESRLSLTVSKSDFENMAIIGQFNLGFILAVRPAATEGDEDQLFIIDQHAADEKYNYERLQRTVTLQNQKLVRAKVLDLTAVEEEIVLNNPEALKANGFEIETIADADNDEFAGRRLCRLLTLPMSREKTFALSDLEELLHLLSEAPAGSSEIPRPKKVQSMLAMRACRSSIMVGKTLTLKQMQKVVRNMGEMEKPWNCPHGRPTMRHLAGLGAWKEWMERETIDEDDGMEGTVMGGTRTDWKGYLSRMG